MLHLQASVYQHLDTERSWTSSAGRHSRTRTIVPATYKMANKGKLTFLPTMEKRPPFSHEVPGPKVDGETRPRRRNLDDLVTQPHPYIRTAYDIVGYAAKKFGNADCVGTRRTLTVHTETTTAQKTVNGQVTDVKKDWSYFELSPYSFHSFIDFQKLVGHFGAGLKQLGLTKGDIIHLYGATR